MGVNKFFGTSADLLKVIPVLVFEGIYIIIYMKFPDSYMKSNILRTLYILLMSFLVFKDGPERVRKIVMFMLLWFSSAGAAALLAIPGRLPLLGGAMICLFFCRLFHQTGRSRKSQVITTIIRYGEKVYHLRTLIDTGNLLKDPVTGESVLVLGSSTAHAIFGYSAEQLRTPLDTIRTKQCQRFRLIPYSSIGNKGLMLAVRLPDVEIEGIKQKKIVALAPGNLDGFDALLGEDCV